MKDLNHICKICSVLFTLFLIQSNLDQQNAQACDFRYCFFEHDKEYYTEGDNVTIHLVSRHGAFLNQSFSIFKKRDKPIVTSIPTGGTRYNWYYKVAEIKNPSPLTLLDPYKPVYMCEPFWIKQTKVFWTLPLDGLPPGTYKISLNMTMFSFRYPEPWAHTESTYIKINSKPDTIVRANVD